MIVSILHSITIKSKIFIRVLTLVLCVVLAWPDVMVGQYGSHPRIYTTDRSGEKFLGSLKDIPGKMQLVNKKRERLEKYIKLWSDNSEWLVSRLQMNWKTKHDKVFLKGGDFSHSEGNAPVPTVRFSGTRDWATDYKAPSIEEVSPYFDDPQGMYLEHKKTGKLEWVHPSKSGHIIEGINRKIMALVEDAAFLYWATGDTKYAEFATPVFLTYIEGMYYREAPIDLENSNQQHLSGLATFEVIHEKILVHLVTVYDFLFNYFQEQNISVKYCEAVFQKWGDQIIKNGVPNNNWNLFQARFLTYVALVLEPNSAYKNGKGKEFYLEHTFDTSTDRQIALRESLLVYDQKNGIWPESASYSVHVITTLLNIITLLDHATNAQELSNFPIVEKAALASFQYLFPNGYTVGFGDSSHKPLPAENFELLLTNYKKYDQREKLAIVTGLLNTMIAKGEYDRKANDLFELFFYVDTLPSQTHDGQGLGELVSPTFYAPNVSMFNQRLGTGENALMVSTVGSYGNHAHANGVSLELYAKGYVMAPDMGKGPSYWHDDHIRYYSRMPAHNTVVVDGVSDYRPMRSYHPFDLEHFFPSSGKNPLFDKLTFSEVSFVEPKTRARQKRFTALVKGLEGKGYVVDVFRSKKEHAGPQRHDYLYHNLGRSLKLYRNDTPLTLNQSNVLGSHKGDLKAYDYLSNLKKITTSDDVQALFALDTEPDSNLLMKVWVQGGQNQALFTATAPESRASTKGTTPESLLGKPLPTLIVQRNDSAWERPFALVFNPYSSEVDNPVRRVDFLNEDENTATQIIEVGLSDGKTIDRFVLNPDENNLIEKEDFYQKGLLSIVRKKSDGKTPDFMLLSGMFRFQHDNWGVEATGKPVTVSIEMTESGIVLQNDAPLVLQIPKPEHGKSAIMELYMGGDLIARRKGLESWNNDRQLEFRLEKAYTKALITIIDLNEKE